WRERRVPRGYEVMSSCPRHCGLRERPSIRARRATTDREEQGSRRSISKRPRRRERSCSTSTEEHRAAERENPDGQPQHPVKLFVDAGLNFLSFGRAGVFFCLWLILVVIVVGSDRAGPFHLQIERGAGEAVEVGVEVRRIGFMLHSIAAHLNGE